MKLSEALDILAEEEVFTPDYRRILYPVLNDGADDHAPSLLKEFLEEEEPEALEIEVYLDERGIWKIKGDGYIDTTVPLYGIDDDRREED